MRIHDPPMLFKNDAARQLWESGLANNQDHYGNAVYRYASEWANRMERELAKGTDRPGEEVLVRDIAERTSREADTEGITAFMYGAAVSILAADWKHGEELRRWHNLDTQIGNEGEKANESGGVLNPAVLKIGEKS